MTTLTCFKAYDIRGRLPDQLNETIAGRIGRAFTQYLQASRVVVGQDVRPSSPALATALINGIREGGADVLDIGLCGTEEVYHATAHSGADGGIMVTASHNPADYNGMKLVRSESRPISGDSGLGDIRTIAETADFRPVARTGTTKSFDVRAAYLQHLLETVDRAKLHPLKIVVNAGNGCAGPVLDLLESHLPFELIKICHQPDGTFPNGIPNPLLPENRQATRAAVLNHGADLGIAWDGDFDRCFLFDERGQFIEGYYIVGLLAEVLLARHPGGRIIHDPRLTWNTIEMVLECGGEPVVSKTGHAFIKERMRQEDAVYGGEMSAHHYFRDFFYCDSGMISWLMVTELMCRKHRRLSELVGARMARFPASGEINRRHADPAGVIAAVENRYAPDAEAVEHIDGLSVEFRDWRFNLRMSNTEPVIRLNVESRGDRSRMEQKTEELLAFIDTTAA